MSTPAWVWISFNAVILTLLVLDLAVFHRKTKALSIREALIGSAGWISLALAFNAGILYFRGTTPALEFLTGYLIELSLSVDNLFVFLAIFTFFQVRPEHQHRVLFWGILGAIVLRITLILAGISLIERFHWLVPALGAFLVFTGVRLVKSGDDHVDFEHNVLVRVMRRLIPTVDSMESGKFFVRQAGRLYATPLLLVLVVVEFTDVVFALDSVPAILAITRDAFIAYSSNLFAILGLRAMFFALAGMMRMFVYLKYGLSAILVFVGVKMIIQEWFHIHVGFSLAVVVTILGASIAASIALGPKGVEGPAEAIAGHEGLIDRDPDHKESKPVRAARKAPR
jgi:tellurite resistance protein TerC